MLLIGSISWSCLYFKRPSVRTCFCLHAVGDLPMFTFEGSSFSDALGRAGSKGQGSDRTRFGSILFYRTFYPPVGDSVREQTLLKCRNLLFYEHCNSQFIFDLWKNMYTDALVCNTPKIDEFEKKLSVDVVKRIEDDLDVDEKVSVLFFMTKNYASAYQEIDKLLHTDTNNMLATFISNQKGNWKSSLLEALCIIQNWQVIRKLGIVLEDLKLLFLPLNGSCSRNVNRVAKCLYLLCEALTEDRTKSLIECVKNDLTEYKESLMEMNFLELHILYWVQQKYISIDTDGKVNLMNLLKHLKLFDDLQILYEDLKKYEASQNVLDLQYASSTGSMLQPFSMGKNLSNMLPRIKEEVKKVKKGLCIIISEMMFTGQKYETRFGNLADCCKLSETFKHFNFRVEMFKDLKKDEMLKKLEDLPNDFGTDYDCIFICILSHGCKGGIITSDEEKIDMETIEHKICCPEFINVIKVVVVQACQGDVMGQADDLAMDGPVNRVSNILAYSNFCVFMSTMQGFVSVRHKEEGSWFIQTFCNILQNEGSKITFLSVVDKTIESVMQKKGKLNGKNSIAQLPELRPYRLLKDFQLPEYKALNNER